MGLPSINFADIAPQGNPALANIIPLLVAGFKASQVPTQEAAANRHAALANAILSTQNQYLPQEMQGKITGQNLANTQTGIQNQYMPQQLQGSIAGQNLRNVGQSISNQYMPQQMQNQQALQSAQIKGADIANQFAPQTEQAKLDALKSQNFLTNMKAQMGGGVSGPIAQALQLQFIKNRFGEQSPQYQQGQAAYTSTMAKYSSPISKLQREKSDIDSGYMPGTGRTQALDPNKQNLLSNTYALAIQKATTDSGTRQKSLNAQNIEKTLAMIDPKDLTQYAGLVGHIAKGDNFLVSPFGGETGNYDRYTQALALTHRLTSQVRQFYGDSVMPSNVEKLLDEFETGRAMSNPKLALKTFGTLKNVLAAETGTYTGALKSTKPYEQLDSSGPSGTTHHKFNPSTGDFVHGG